MKNKLFKILFVLALLVVPVTNVFGAVSDYIFINSSDNLTIYNKSDLTVDDTIYHSSTLYEVHADSDYIYSTTGSDEILIYDLSTHSLQDTLNFSNSINFIDSDSDYFYFVSDDTIYKYSKSNLSSVNSVVVSSGNLSRGLEVTDSYIYITSDDGSVYKHNKSDLSFVDSFVVSSGSRLDGININDGRIYVEVTLNHEVKVYDELDYSLIDTLYYNDEYLIKTSIDSNHLYFTGQSIGDGVYVFNKSNLSFDRTVSVSNPGAELSVDSSYIYHQCNTDDVCVYNKSDDSLYTTLTNDSSTIRSIFTVIKSDPSATASHQNLMADSVELTGTLENIDINNYSVGDLTGYFEVYNSDGSLYKTSPAFDLVEQNNNVVYSLSSLTPETGYSYKFKVEDDVNQITWWSSEKTFTTETPSFTTSVDSKTDDSFTVTTSIDNLLISSYSSGNLVGYYHIYDSNGDLYYTTNEYDLVERDGSLQLKISGLSASSQYDYEFVVKDTSSAETALYYSNKYEVWTNSEDTSEPTYSADLSQPDAWISGSGCVSAFVTWEYENPNPDTAVLNLSIFDVVNGELNEKFGEHTFENVDSSGTEKVDFCNLDQTKVYQVEASLLVSDSEAKVRKSEITLSMEEDDWVPIFFNYMSNWFSNILIPSDPQWAVDTMNNLEDTILEPIVQFEDLFEQYHTDIENNSLDANDVLLVELTNESVSFIPEDKTLTLFSKEMLTQSGIMGNTSPTGQTWWNFLMSIVEFSFYIGLFVYLWKRIKGLLQTGVHM